MRGRVRWDNVGRVAGAVAVLALVVAWPRLDGDPLVAPGGEVVPLVAGPSPRPAPAPQVVPTPTATAQVGKVREKPERRRDRRAKPRDAAPPPPAAPHAQPVAPAPQAPTRAAPPPPAPTIDPAEREFGFER
jgi:hypothetical protein